MADLQKFDEFVTTLRDEVTALGDHKAMIASELVTLEARRGYLKGSIASLSKQADDEKQKRQKVLTELDKNIQERQAAYAAVEKSIAWLEEKQRLATETLQTMQQSTDEDMVKFNGQIEAKKAVLTEVETTKVALQADCDALGQEIAGRTKSLEVLDQQVVEKQAETDEKIRQMTASTEPVKQQLANAKRELDNKLDELEEAEKKAVDAEKLIAEARKQHNEFLAYEERVKKALEARENALLEHERELEVNIVTSKRRNGVLDKL